MCALRLLCVNLNNLHWILDTLRVQCLFARAFSWSARPCSCRHTKWLKRRCLGWTMRTAGKQSACNCKRMDQGYADTKPDLTSSLGTCIKWWSLNWMRLMRKVPIYIDVGVPSAIVINHPGVINSRNKVSRCRSLALLPWGKKYLCIVQFYFFCNWIMAKASLLCKGRMDFQENYSLFSWQQVKACLGLKLHDKLVIVINFPCLFSMKWKLERT